MSILTIYAKENETEIIDIINRYKEEKTKLSHNFEKHIIHHFQGYPKITQLVTKEKGSYYWSARSQQSYAPMEYNVYNVTRIVANTKDRSIDFHLEHIISFTR